MKSVQSSTAVDTLARAMFEKLEQLDPAGLSWADLTECERSIYSATVRYLLRQKELDQAVADLRDRSSQE